MIVDYRKRAHDGKMAVWKHQPTTDMASAWVCIEVCETVKDALAKMKLEREAA